MLSIPKLYTRQVANPWLVLVINLLACFSTAPHPNVSITLKFIEFGTECSYDYLFIHDGDSYLSPLIGSISGNNSLHTVVSHSGQVGI